jgi:hypothetical protein
MATFGDFSCGTICSPLGADRAIRKTVYVFGRNVLYIMMPERVHVKYVVMSFAFYLDGGMISFRKKGGYFRF